MKLPEGGRVNCFFSVFWSHTCDVIVFPHQSVPHDAKHPSGHCRQKHTRCVPLRIFLIGDMIQIPSEIWVSLIHRQDISRPIKGPLEESLMYFVPLVWRVKSHKCQCTCQLFYCKIYTWFQNQTIKIWNLGTQTLGQACCILHDWSFHTWLVQAFWVVFFFFFNAASLPRNFSKEGETASRSKLTYSSVNQWQWRILWRKPDFQTGFNYCIRLLPQLIKIILQTILFQTSFQS